MLRLRIGRDGMSIVRPRRSIMNIRWFRTYITNMICMTVSCIADPPHPQARWEYTSVSCSS